MIVAAEVSVNSTYLILGAVASAGAIGTPVFRKIKSALKTPAEERRMLLRLDRTVFGAEATRYDKSVEGIVVQQEKTAKAVTTLTETVMQLVREFREHVQHPPGTTP